MGYDLKQIRIALCVSRHSSDQDLVDDALVHEFQERITSIVCDPRYESLNIDIELPG